MASNLNTHHLNDSVVDHMRKDFAQLSADQTVGEALASIRQAPPSNRIVYFYAMDEQGRLAGVIPTRRLLLSELSDKISDIMIRGVITIPVTATVLDACEFFIMHKLLAFPVVNQQGQMLGVVDVELYTDELKDIDRLEDSDQLFQLIGIHLTASQQASPFTAFRLRFPWLLANIVGGVLAAFLSGAFEDVLQRVVALALFIPVVLALAESVSIQSVSLSLQTVGGGRPTLQRLLSLIRNEASAGVLLGLACGISIAVISLLWLGEWKIASCLLGGILGGVSCAAVFGAAIPNLIRMIQLEPQVAAGPLSLACTDMATLLIYFTLAKAIF